MIIVASVPNVGGMIDPVTVANGPSNSDACEAAVERLNNRYMHLRAHLKVGGRADDESPVLNRSTDSVSLNISSRYSVRPPATNC